MAAKKKGKKGRKARPRKPELKRAVEVIVPVLKGGNEAQLRRSLNAALRLVPTKVLEEAETIVVTTVREGK
jgi:hypothetical protein